MRVNEIFYSFQGEGHYSGRPAIFIRFSGCNLKCSFCDTEFDAYIEMTPQEIIANAQRLSVDCKFVVLTGGEPTLQADEAFIDLLHENGYYVAMETNGTNKVPGNVDWVTCSPKYIYTDARMGIDRIDEVKIVFDGIHSFDVERFTNVGQKYIQPCDTRDEERNLSIVQGTIDWLLKHPDWNLSLQTHKIVGAR